MNRRPWSVALLLLTVSAAHADAPNLALNASVTGVTNASGSRGKPLAATDGDVADYGQSHGYAWGWLKDPLVLTLAESAGINKVDVLLLDVDPRSYDFRLEGLAPDGWTRLAESETASGWVTLTFDPVECSAIRLVFTRTSLSAGSYHVVEVAAYDAPEPDADSPLKKAWLATREERKVGDLHLLGIDEALEHVFLDEDMLARAKALEEGDRRWLDTDGDGDADLIVLNDAGVLVCVIDDDDDAGAAPDADEDSDCWVADVDRDGSPDRVIDYWDDDGDGDVDRAHHYYVHHGWFGSTPGLVVIWDYNDNNQTWVLDRYSYHQGKCQWKCDFGGDEGFSIFRHDKRSDEWVADWECPFYFYDPDDDGLAEVAVRLEGHGRRMRALRYSLNADNDVAEGQPYDYDMGITALGPIEFAEADLVTSALRVGETGPYLPWDTARDVVRDLPWTQSCLVWDENDLNIDPNDRTRHERWEGILNARYGAFPQVGGPHCGTLNKRYEHDADNSGKMMLYASPVDGRLHLFGAESGTLWADDDADGRPDRIVQHSDTDGDGYFDTWQFDDGADGSFERTYKPDDAYSPVDALIPLDWGSVTQAYVPLLEATVQGHEQVARALGGILTEMPISSSLEGRRWALERRIHLAFSHNISAETDAGDEARAEKLADARAFWERGQYDAATRHMRASAD